MLLQTLPFFNNSWCDKPFLISKFMKGVFHRTPPKPRYSFTWDVSVVLNFLRTLFPLSSLSLKLLTFKLTALIALCTAPRAQTLVALNIDFMVFHDNKVVFHISSLLKTSRVGHSAFSLVLEKYDPDEKLCVVKTLLHYLKRTESLRESKQLLVSFVTYKGVTSSTVARWLREVLSLSGINTDVFKAHSFRSAAVSAAYTKGCSVSNILKTAMWNTEKNFYKFYFRNSVPDNAGVAFPRAVLSNV
jgi:hypothetical protein